MTTELTTQTRRAYAKINLTLDVGARRADGYHDIRSVMQTIALCDTLTVTRTPARPGVLLEVTGPEARGVPADASNLVHRAAARLQKIAAARGVVPGDRSGLHIVLEKHIPSQAGLGGGSSDAAQALLAADALLGLGLSPDRLSALAASLGADVPFFLAGGTALAEGLGERVTPLPPPPPFFLVIVKPPVGVPTPAAYGALDALPGRVPGAATEAYLAGRDVLSNDFGPVILPAYPDVARASEVLAASGGTGGADAPLLCGSGAALFRRAAGGKDAQELAARVEAANVGRVWVTRTVGPGE